MYTELHTINYSLLALTNLKKRKMSKKSTSLENYVNLLSCELRTKNNCFSVKNFIKKLRPFCKTTLSPDNKLITLSVRNSNTSLLATFTDNNTIILKTSKNNFTYTFYFIDAKDLLQKMVKHNLLNH